jgi:hypothetical protein
VRLTQLDDLAGPESPVNVAANVDDVINVTRLWLQALPRRG